MTSSSQSEVPDEEDVTVIGSSPARRRSSTHAAAAVAAVRGEGGVLPGLAAAAATGRPSGGTEAEAERGRRGDDGPINNRALSGLASEAF